MIASHDRFFTRMIGMIPTELYQHTDSVTGFKNDTTESKTKGTAAPKPEKVKKVPMAPDATMEDINSKYYKHKKLPLTANEKKLVRQERKKRKYEPSQSEVEDDIVPSSSNMEADGSDDESEASGGDDNEEETKKSQIVFKKDAPSGNLEELRKRLQDRIAHMREQRQTKKPRNNDLKPNGSQSNANNQKQDAASVSSSTVNSINNHLQNGKGTSTTSGKSSTSDSLARAEALQQELHAAPTVTVSSSGLEFNPITQTEESISAQIRQLTKKKDGGKKARLERLLKEAEQKRQRLTTMMNSNDEDQQAKARAEQWNDVMTVASGGKALLVSTIGHNAAQATSRAEQKIKKALKKREKKKEKSATEWNERLHTLDEEQQARLKKRDDNLKNKKTRHLGPAGGVAEGGEGAEGEGEQPKKRPRLGGPNGIKGGAARSQNEDSSSSHNNSHSSKKGGSGGGKGGNNNGNRRAGFEGKKTNSAFLNKK